MIRKVTINTGPTEIRYKLDQSTGDLEVWIGPEIVNAPEDAQAATVAPGFTRWILETQDLQADPWLTVQEAAALVGGLREASRR